MKHLLTDPDKFLAWLHQAIPLTSAMQIERLVYDGRHLELHAPLAPNVNDKGTGFGGSIAALATLAGWCLTTLYLREQGLDCDVVIADSHLSYTAPVKAALCARVVLPDAEQCQHLLDRLTQRGRGRLELHVDLISGDDVAMTLDGRYVAIQR